MDNQTFSSKIRPFLLIVALCIVLTLPSDRVGAEGLNISDTDRQAVQKLLTREEKAWVSTHKTIRIAGPKAFPPFHYYEQDGSLKGMASDYIHLIFNYLNIQPDIQSNMEWATVLKAAEERRIDLISCSAKTIDREPYLWFTEPYLSFPLVIITKTDSPFIGGPGDLHDKTVAFIKGAAAYDWIGQGDSKIIPYFVETPADALKAVSLGHADAHIDNLAAATYLIRKHGLANLKIAAPAFNENYDLYIAVRKDWPELASIINKILAAMTPQQHSEIRNRWLSVKFEHGIRKTDVVKWILGISGFALSVLTIILLWNRRLAREVYERKNAEERLKKIFDNTQDAIIIHDLEGHILDVNDKMCRMYGLTKQDACKKNIKDISGSRMPKDSLREKWQRVLNGEKLIFEWDAFRPGEGSAFNVEISLQKISFREKDIVLANVRDITESKRAEKEKIEARRQAAEHENYALVGRIAGKMAHDFNNILGAIMGNSELALLECPHEKTKKKLELIFEQTLRGKNLTKNLVAFARDQEPRQEFFSIEEKMELVLNLLKKDLQGIHVNRQYGRRMPELLADPGMIEHAVVNLVQNAIHALSLVKDPEIIVRTYHQTGLIFLEIEDNGCGIPSECITEIFDPSFTLKGSRDKTGMYKPGIKGTGYGMSNVKKYIDLHKGDISITSEIKKGTKVVISLPVIEKKLTDDDIKKVTEEKFSSGKYILLVEDEQAISDVQYSILTQAPCRHKVDTAGNGQAAMDLLNRNTYDFVSLDYMLPGEITGMDIYRYIRKTNKTIPILFISGNIEFLESIHVLKQKDPNIDHLSKPCKNVDYITCINKRLAGLNG
jgi:PAS domain S-box-containing protein